MPSSQPAAPSQINECIIVQQIYCRSPCSSCRSGHCGLCLLRADFPHTHRCSSCYQRWKRRSLVTGFGPVSALSKVFLWLCHLSLAFSGSAPAFDRRMRLCPWNGRLGLCTFSTGAWWRRSFAAPLSCWLPLSLLAQQVKNMLALLALTARTVSLCTIAFLNVCA